jgi:general secretion pathway protein B
MLGRDDTDEPVSAATASAPPAALSGQDVPVDAEPLQRLDVPVPEQPRALRPRVNFPPPPAAKPARPAVARSAPAPDAQPHVTVSEVPLSAGDVDTGLPEWGELSLEFRSGFPLPHIDVYVYAEEPARRFVMIDLKKYREGDALGNGALLEKIGPASIQLFYQGTRFRVNR